MALHDGGNRLGRYVESTYGEEKVRAFVPPPLPPNPPIDIVRLMGRLTEAERALGRLDGVTLLLPHQEIFLYMYVKKEAVLSSQIEGTQSTLADLLRSELEQPVPFDDVREVSNYVDALLYGLERLKSLPLSLRLIQELHQRMLKSGRGSDKAPGEFRRSQNWVGGTRPGNAMFVPPPIHEMHQCLHEFELFLHENESCLPPLIKAGLIHVQFETIHPFLDGNGRIGRLLITLYLHACGVLETPLLYLSLYLKRNRSRYYQLLQEVRESGAWEEWLEFFLDGVAETANQAFVAAKKVIDLFEKDRARLAAEGDRAGSLLRLHEAFQKHPYGTGRSLVGATGLSYPTVYAALEQLTRLGIVTEVTGKRRDRIFAYTAYLDILNEGTEPLPRTR